MSVAAAIGWGLALILFLVSLWIRRQRRFRPGPTAAPARPPDVGTPKPSEMLIWINVDGTARQLTGAEKTYVDAPFSPFDGARPYVKSHYEQRNGWGELGGYLLRKEVPDGIPIAVAPPDDPAAARTPQAVADSLRELIRKHGRQQS